LLHQMVTLPVTLCDT